jgi:hypothetical protein
MLGYRETGKIRICMNIGMGGKWGVVFLRVRIIYIPSYKPCPALRNNRRMRTTE